MKKLLCILLCLIGVQVYAADFTPFNVSMQTPAAAMCSVNKTALMSSGSTYSSSVSPVGSSNPYSSPPKGQRRSGGFGDITVDDGSGTTEADVNPQNTQFSPLGDALIPLLIMAFIYAIVLYRRKTKVSDL